MRVDSGQVVVRPGPAGRLGVRGTARYALVRSQVSWHSSPSGVSVVSRCRQLTGPCSFGYQVAAPRGMPVHVTSASGDVTASGLAGRATLEAGSGTVRLRSLSGTVSAHAASGDITGSALTGPSVTAGCGSGSVTLTGVRSRDVAVSDASGDVTLRLSRVPASVRITAGSGDVRVVLPPGRTAYRVRASAGSGTTSVTVPQDPASPHVITITDGSGDITVSQ